MAVANQSPFTNKLQQELNQLPPFQGIPGAVLVNGVIYQDQPSRILEIPTTESEWTARAQENAKDYYHRIANHIPVPMLQWVLCDKDTIPKSAISCGNEKHGLPLFAARAYHKNGIHIGKASVDGFHLPWGGKEVKVHAFEVLVGLPHSVRWIPVNGTLDQQNDIFQGKKLLRAGIDDGKPLYVAHAMIEGGVHIGKCAQGTGAFIPYGGSENVCNQFRVLAFV